MSHTITVGVTTYTLLAFDGFAGERRARNVLHALANSNAKAVALRTAAKRSGRARVLMPVTGTSAMGLVNALSTASTATLATTATDLTGLGMTFVVSGSVRYTLDATRTRWVIEFDYQEV